jgi:hypothetical protein
LIAPSRIRRLPPADRLCPLVWLALVAAGTAHAGEPGSPPAGDDCRPALVFAEPHSVYGDRYQFGEVAHRFAFSNQGTRPVEVTDTVAVTGDGELTVTPRRLGPGESGAVEVRQPLGGRLGRAAFRYALLTDEPCVDRYRFSLSGFAQSAYDPERGVLDLGTVDRDRGGSAELELASREVGRLEVTSIAGAPGWLRVEVAGRAGETGEGVLLRATAAPGAPLGLHAGQLELRTGVPHQPRLEVGYSVAVYGDVVPSAAAVDLGLARVGEELTGELALRSRSAAAFVVERVADPAGAVDAEVAPCPGDPPGCALLRLRHRAVAETALDGRLLVHLAAGGEPLPIGYRGWVVAAGTAIRDLGVVGSETGEAGAAGEGGAAGPGGPAAITGSSGAEPGVPPAASSAGASPPAPTSGASSPDAAPEPGSPAQTGNGDRWPTVHWTVVDETGIYGYQVYRSERREGPFRRVDDGIVHVPHDDGADRHSYTWTDRTAEPCRTYHYYLDLVGFGGLKQRFSGVASKTVPCG